MNETKVYADSYCAVFREQKDFLECIRSRMKATEFSETGKETVFYSRLLYQSSYRLP